MPITGECFCGAISYQYNGKPGKTISCHCSRCRKAFNAQASASVFIDPDQFQWLSGEALLSSFIGKQGFGVQFCKTCGSTLCTVHHGKVFQLTLGCINGSPDIKIDQHIFVGSKASWEVMPEGVVQLQEGAE